MKKYILTVGPSLMTSIPLSDIHNERHIYRINGAHGGMDDVETYIADIRQQIPCAEIMLHLPGNKIRTKDIAKSINLVNGKNFEIPNENFNYPDFYKHVKPGMTIWANDSIFEFEVVSADQDKVVFLSKSDGVLTNNKGMHARGIHNDIPFIFEKDRQLIDLINKHKLTYAGLSFVRTAQNIKEALSLLNPDVRVISKIETIDAVMNINEILSVVEYILVDRGDLSTDIGIEKIPRYQKFIIDKALYYDVKIFLATQILKNMETKPIPTIGEIEALYDIFKSGVYGVQMSEETAVGKYVKECVRMLNIMNDEIVAEKLVSTEL